MNYKQKIKRDTSKILDEETPKIPSLEQIPVSHKPNRRILIPVLAASVIAIGGAFAGLGFHLSAQSNSSLDNTLVSLSPRKPKAARLISISKKSAEIYRHFYQTFTPWVFQGVASSQSFSVFDAYVNAAMIYYFSEGEIQENLAYFFASASIEEVATSVREFTYAIGTPVIEEGNAYGGYSANSLWYDDKVVALRRDAELSTLANSFYADRFASRPSASAITKWLNFALPEQYPLPDISFDNSEVDVAFVSSYFLRRPNKAESSEKAKPYFYIDYSYQGSKEKRRGHRFSGDGDYYYESDTLFGGKASYGMEYFLAKDDSSSPLSILGDVLAENYQAHFANQKYVIDYPYFTLDRQEIDLTKAFEKTGKPIAGRIALQKLFVEPLEFSWMKQFSKVNLDYTGFYSASVTISAERVTSPAPIVRNGTFEMVLDRPYLFVDKIKVDYVDFPLVVGVIFEPGWVEK